MQEYPTTFFSQNYLYNVVNASRVFLRQPMLIFNFPGKKIPALHCYPARLSENKKSQPAIMFNGFLPASTVKKTKNYAVPASVKWKLEFASQRQLKQVMGQPAKFHLTHCQEKHISQERSVLRQIYIKRKAYLTCFTLLSVVSRVFVEIQGKDQCICLQYCIFSIKRRTPIKRRPRLNAGSKLLIFK